MALYDEVVEQLYYYIIIKIYKLFNKIISEC